MFLCEALISCHELECHGSGFALLSFRFRETVDCFCEKR